MVSLLFEGRVAVLLKRLRLRRRRRRRRCAGVGRWRRWRRRRSCGTAAATRRTQRVDDVEAFPGHIACDAASRSEIVIPLLRDGELLGVLDIDSPEPARFTAEDQAGLEAIAAAFLRLSD